MELNVVVWKKVVPKGSGTIRKGGLPCWRKCVTMGLGSIAQVSFVQASLSMSVSQLPVTCKM